MLDVKYITSTSQFEEEILNKSNGFNYLRPKVLFNHIEKNNNVPINMTLQIPSSNIGSLTMLEATILVTLIKIIQPKAIFEFGTFLGYSTFIFLSNSSQDCMVYSLDLGDGIQKVEYTKDLSIDDLKKNDVVNDNYLSYVQAVKGVFYLSSIHDEYKMKLNLLLQDSRFLNVEFLNLSKKIDFVFIDGGHELDIIKIDTQNAFKLIGDYGVVIWHDYNSKIHQDVTLFLNEICDSHKIFHVENTMLAFCLIGVII